MAGKNWQAGSKNLIPATAVVCLVAGACRSRLRMPRRGDFAPASYVGSLDPNLIWEVLIGGIVVASFLGAIAIWVVSALRRAKRSQLRRNAFIRSALNHLNQGVVMTDPRGRIMFCNDRYLEIYGLARADVPRDMTGRELLELRRKRGVLDVSVEDFYSRAADAGRARHRTARRPHGPGQVFRRCPMAVRSRPIEDCTEQRKLSRKLSSTTQFLESVLDNVPVCVAAKNIEDGRYIFANRAFERFSRFSRDHIVGKRADEIFQARRPRPAIEARRTKPALHADGGLSPQRIRGRARLGEARPCLQPRDRAQREAASRNS